MNQSVRQIKLQPNRHKLLEAILFLIEEGERSGRPLTQYQIAKSIFFADTAHLNAYGRPVTFDNYAAMKFGPVPEEAYDMLRPSYDWQRRVGESGPLWDREQVGATAFQYVRPTRPANRRALSKSDIKALTDALAKVRELGFGGVRDETHEHRAYIEAWERRGDKKSAPMSYALLLDEADEERVGELAYVSAHI